MDWRLVLDQLEKEVGRARAALDDEHEGDFRSAVLNLEDWSNALADEVRDM